MKHKREVFIVDGARSPFLKAKGMPGPFSAADLAVGAGKVLLSRQPFSPHKFSQVVMGCVVPSADEANIARIIALRLGCGDQMPAWTVQRNCASGLQSIDSAANAIADGQSDLVLAGGTEAMSRAPLLFNQSMVRWLASIRRAQPLPKKLATFLKFRPQLLVPVVALLKGLSDPIVNLSMGQTAEELAYLFHISRTEMDQYAIESHHRVLKAQAAGALEEIVPLYGMDGSVLEKDDGVRDSTLEQLAKLKPVFEKYGSITAGNSSQVSDGAALVILASREAIERYQLPVLARIVDVSWAALNPAIMGLGPVHAIKLLLHKHQLTLKDIDHMEINEAFAAQVLACVKALHDADLGEMDLAKLNPQGGAIAIGHPVGASGARLVLHCANMLKKYQTRRAMASLCIGGGQGGAILLERVAGV